MSTDHDRAILSLIIETEQLEGRWSFNDRRSWAARAAAYNHLADAYRDLGDDIAENGGYVLTGRTQQILVEDAERYRRLLAAQAERYRGEAP